MVLVFSDSGGSTITKGPYSQVRFEGEVVRSVANGPIIARHENHVWKVDGKDYPRCDCEEAAWVHFERVDGSKSKTYGPLEHLSFMDGVAFVDRRVFAFVDRGAVDWYCHDDGRHWPLMLIEPSASH